MSGGTNLMPRWLFTVMVGAVCLVIGFGVGTEYGKRRDFPTIAGVESQPVTSAIDGGELTGLKQRVANLENQVAQLQKPTAQSAPTLSGSKNSTFTKDPADVNRRCSAITKKGTQCKRKAQPGKEYCWQHAI